MTALGDQLDGRIGEFVTFTAPEEFGRAAGRYFARSLGDEHPLFFSGPALAEHGLDEPIIPPTLIFETNQYTDLPQDEFGSVGFLWFEESHAFRMVRGGNSYTWTRDVRPSDQIQVVNTLASVKHSHDREGRPMHIVTSTITYDDQHGERIAEQDEWLILIELVA